MIERTLALLLLSGLAGLAAAQDAATPPATKREPVVETLHGVKLSDPYRWLEGDAAGRITKRVGAWTDAQNAYTRRVLDGIPGRKKIEARLKVLMTASARVGTPTMRGRRYFYRRRAGTQNQSVLYVREGLQGKPRVLIDPNTLHAKGLIALDWFEPTEDGRLLAFGLSKAGDEKSTLHVLDVASGRWLADTIPNKVRGVDWLPNGRGFFYRNLADVKNPYSAVIRFHRLGEHPRQDKTLYTQRGTTYGPYAWISPDARWMMLSIFTGTRSNDLWVIDLDRWFRSGELVRADVVVGRKDAASWGPILGDTLYLQTTLDAPKGRVVAVDLTRPAQKHWKEVIPQRKDAVLKDVSLARGMLVVEYEQRASSRIERFRYDGTPLGAVDLPGIGSAGISTHRDRTEAFLSYTSYNHPRSVFRLDLAKNTRTLWQRPKIPVDPNLVQVKQVTYPSKDGTPITMFLVHRKGIRLDGNNPTLLYGYGGFNISLTPYFSATLFPWFEAGGVYAVANLRGGGEYGDAWHKAGMLENKQNVFDDFIAAAEWLIKTKYTNPKRLAIAGGSNGGLLTGAVLVQRPELFRAAISAVPLLDMLRFHRFLMARFWVPEYGTAEKAKQFRFLRKYSPYQNVKQGVRYPAVFLTAGENDSRVHPLHARKMAAALQAATSAAPAERPILLWVDRQAGHGSGKPLALRIRDKADQRLFLMWQLGMLNGTK